MILEIVLLCSMIVVLAAWCSLLQLEDKYLNSRINLLNAQLSSLANDHIALVKEQKK